MRTIRALSFAFLVWGGLMSAPAAAQQYEARRNGDIVQLEDKKHQTVVSILTSVGNMAYEMKVNGHISNGATAVVSAMLSQSTRLFSSVVSEPLRRPDSMHAGQRCCPCSSTSHSAQTNRPQPSHGTWADLFG